MKKIEEELKKLNESSGNELAESTSPEEVLSCPVLTKTDCKAVQTNLSFSYENDDTRSKDAVAYVHVCWPTGDRSRRLPSDLTRIAIHLLRTQNKEIAKASWAHPLIRH